jgi:O-antigen/teichoic acid export membrane protein
MTTGISQKGAFRRNVKWQLVGSASQAVLSGLLLLLMGRELGTSGFGVFSIVMGYVYVANLLFEPRIQDVAAKQFSNFDLETRASGDAYQYFIDLFAVEALSKLLPCLALVLLAPLLAQLGNLPSSTVSLIIVAAVGTFFAKLGNGLSVGFLRALGRSDLHVYCGTGELLLRLLLTVILTSSSMLTVSGAVIILSVSGIASNLLQWALTGGQISGVCDAFRQWRVSAAIGRLRKNRRLLLSNLGLSASDLMNKDLDVTLIAPFMLAEQVGIYKMAKNICLLTWRAIDPFYMALMPELSRIVSTGNFEGVKRLLRISSIGLFCFSLALALATFILFKFFGGQVLGEEFSEVLTVMPWMLIGIVTSASLVWGHPLSVALERADCAVIGSLLGSLLGFFAFLSLTPLHLLTGASIAWTLSFVTHFIFTSAVSFRLLANRSLAAQ